jgi:hypothetical protein
MVELAVFKMPEPNRLLIRPRTLAKTEAVRRVVLGVERDGSQTEKVPASVEKVEILSSEAYWSALESSVPNVRATLERLIEAVIPLECIPTSLAR